MRSRLLVVGVALIAGLSACGAEGLPVGPILYGNEPDGLRSDVARAALLVTSGEPLIDPAELVDAASYDGIPSVDEPVVVSRERADAALTATEQVMLVTHGESARAYPVRSLVRHEIVNDVIGDLPLAVTWCPLCNTGIAFDRRVDGTAEVFGVSGALYRSALVMFDRRTASLWPQPLGLAVLGPQLGAELRVLPASLLPWQQVRDAHPDVEVVLGSEGELDETRNPYVGYDLSTDPFLFDGEVDARLPATTRVTGVTIHGSSRAWSYDLLRRERAVNAVVGDQPLVVLWAPGSASPLEAGDVREGRDVGSSGVYDPRLDGRALTFRPAGPTDFRDEETGSRWSLTGQAVDGPLRGRSLTPWPHQDAFWFAWAAFQPETELAR